MDIFIIFFCFNEFIIEKRIIIPRKMRRRRLRRRKRSITLLLSLLYSIVFVAHIDNSRSVSCLIDGNWSWFESMTRLAMISIESYRQNIPDIIQSGIFRWCFSFRIFPSSTRWEWSVEDDVFLLDFIWSTFLWIYWEWIKRERNLLLQRIWNDQISQCFSLEKIDLLLIFVNLIHRSMCKRIKESCNRDPRNNIDQIFIYKNIETGSTK